MADSHLEKIQQKFEKAGFEGRSFCGRQKYFVLMAS